MEYHQWYDEHTLSWKKEEDLNIYPPGYDQYNVTSVGKGYMSSNGWKGLTKSWKKSLLLFSYRYGLYMLYPNLPNDMVFSTNLALEGEHPAPGDELNKRKTHHFPLFKRYLTQNEAEAEDRERKTIKRKRRVSFRKIKTFSCSSSRITIQLLTRRTIMMMSISSCRPCSQEGDMDMKTEEEVEVEMEVEE